MKVDSASLSSKIANGQVGDKRDEEKLKSFSDALDKAKESGDAEKLKEVSQEFEAFFINTIFKSMRKSSDWGDGLLEKSHARSMYESMFDEKLADEISSGRGIGVADMIYKQMAKRYLATETPTEHVEKDDEKKSFDLKG